MLRQMLISKPKTPYLVFPEVCHSKPVKTGGWVRIFTGLCSPSVAI